MVQCPDDVQFHCQRLGRLLSSRLPRCAPSALCLHRLAHKHLSRVCRSSPPTAYSLSGIRGTWSWLSLASASTNICRAGAESAIPLGGSLCFLCSSRRLHPRSGPLASRRRCWCPSLRIYWTTLVLEILARHYLLKMQGPRTVVERAQEFHEDANEAFKETRAKLCWPRGNAHVERGKDRSRVAASRRRAFHNSEEGDTGRRGGIGAVAV